MTVTDKAVPNLVGVDIGCGMFTVNLGHDDIDLAKFDEAAHFLPSGFNVWDKRQKHFDLTRLRCYEGRESEIQDALDELRQAQTESEENMTPEDLCCLEGQYFEDYLYDIKICQEFARLNREVITEVLLERTGILTHTIHEFDSFHTIHNYIDTDEMILRKGAIAAHEGERVLIPLNMRDGSLICVGKGNPDWNYSAPHGAGRILSRKDAQDKLTLEEFKKAMTGIYTTCIDTGTLDESPMAYKRPDAILSQINATVDIISQIKPVYNFKASNLINII